MRPLFDETFGFNYESRDFGVRAYLSGHTLLIEPRAQVLHAGGTSGLSFRPGGADPCSTRVLLDTQSLVRRNQSVCLAHPDPCSLPCFDTV